MPTPRKSLARDRKQVSAQPHEIAYTGKKVGRGGAVAVRKAKKALGRKTSRTQVLKRARAIISKIRKATQKRSERSLAAG